LKAVAKDDPLTRFQVASFSQELGTKPGQYLAGAPVLEFFQSIQALRSNDRRTMYRKRLIERLAKELVPATLQQLGIPRPIDPADPYSYSDGVDRVSQKTLTLSAPTRAGLDRFRGGP
jgi:hypothetical protein